MHFDVHSNLQTGATLRPGEIARQVEVHGTEPPLQTDQFDSGQVIDSEAKAGFPLFGCNPLELAHRAVRMAVREPGFRDAS
jgi:hypothetical protein